MKVIYIYLCSRDMDGQKFNLFNILEMKFFLEYIKNLNIFNIRDYVFRIYRQKRKCLKLYVILIQDEIEFFR